MLKHPFAPPPPVKTSGYLSLQAILLYLGQASITRLRMLLMGYSMARGELGLPLTKQEKQFAQFQKWIQQKYQISTTQGWDSIILSQVKSEKLALELFFDLLQEFNLAKENNLL